MVPNKFVPLTSPFFCCEVLFNRNKDVSPGVYHRSATGTGHRKKTKYSTESDRKPGPGSSERVYKQLEDNVWSATIEAVSQSRHLRPHKKKTRERQNNNNPAFVHSHKLWSILPTVPSTVRTTVYPCITWCVRSFRDPLKSVLIVDVFLTFVYLFIGFTSFRQIVESNRGDDLRLKKVLNGKGKGTGSFKKGVRPN